jgi:outer membrane protein
MCPDGQAGSESRRQSKGVQAVKILNRKTLRSLAVPLAATLAATLVTLATLASTAPVPAQAQAAAATAPKIGLIDMAYVFKNYKKFEVLRNDLKAEIEKSDQQAKAMAARIKDTTDRMKTFKEGSPEYLTLEKELAQQASEFEAFRKVAQRDFLRKEADIYKTVYLEVSDAVKLYAQHYNYSLIMRFSREEVADSGDPQRILQSMNRQIVHFLPENDVTETVLRYMNQRYDQQKTAAGAPGNATN